MRRFLNIFGAAVAVLGSMLAVAPPALAADSPVGTWIRTAGAAMPGELTMTIETWGKGKAKITWRGKGQGMDFVMTIKSSLDGKDAPVMVNGKDSGEKMAITMVDKHHTVTVMRMDGKPFGTSKATYSDDFNKLSVENDITFAGGGMGAGKTTETWVRK
jgi:hypothetical protein